MPFAQVHLVEGHSAEQKRAVITKVTQALQDAVGGGLVVAEFLDDQVTVSKVNGPLIPIEAHTGGDTVTPVARGHVVAGAILHRAGFENIAAAQG